MRIFVTNDDGVLSPGLESLAKVAQRYGEVYIVAPDIERSGLSCDYFDTSTASPKDS